MGSPGIAALIAHLAFWALLAYGLAAGALRIRGSASSVLLWSLGLFGLPNLPCGGGFFSSYVALLDIALVFAIFRRDVRLT